MCHLKEREKIYQMWKENIRCGGLMGAMALLANPQPPLGSMWALLHVPAAPLSFQFPVYGLGRQ